MRKTLALAIPLALCTVALARPVPEDYLKGRIIVSDRPLPASWNSVASYVSTLKNLNKGTLWYDKKTGKLTIQYAAFFAQPVNDVQVMLYLYDVTGGAHQQKASTEQFMNKGDRVLFNSVQFDHEDLEGNKKYLMTLTNRGHVIAWTNFILREDGPRYSGRVSFTEEDAKEAH